MIFMNDDDAASLKSDNLLILTPIWTSFWPFFTPFQNPAGTYKRDFKNAIPPHVSPMSGIWGTLEKRAGEPIFTEIDPNFCKNILPL